MTVDPAILSSLFIASVVFAVASSANEHRPCTAEYNQNDPLDPFHSCKIEGNFTVGGLFPMRSYANDNGAYADYEHCNGTLQDNYVVQSEAFLYYLNQASDYLMDKYGFSLGTNLVDSCRSSAIGFKRSLDFIRGDKDFCHDNITHNFSANSPIVISGASSETVHYVNRLLEVFCIPFLATEATATEFSDKNINPYFLRIVPPDIEQVDALIAMMKKFEWNHIGVIYEDTYYSRSLFQDLNTRLNCSHAEVETQRKNLTVNGAFSKKDWTVCMEWSFEVQAPKTPTDFAPLWTYLRKEKKSPRVVLVIMDYIQAGKLFQRLEKLPPSSVYRNDSDISSFHDWWTSEGNRTVQLVSVDGWTGQILKPHKVVNHTIGTLPAIPLGKESGKFKKYLQETPLRNISSPWLQELIMMTHNCCWTDQQCHFLRYPSNCSGDETLPLEMITPVFLQYAERVRQGVEILKQTLEKMHKILCHETALGLCKGILKINGKHLRDQLLNQSRNVTKMNGNSGLGDYYFYHSTLVDGNYTWNDIGNYSKGMLDVKNPLPKNRLDVIAKSINSCFPQCDGGYPFVSWSGSCCWFCQTCNKGPKDLGYIRIDNRSNPEPRCDICVIPKVPTTDYRSCSDSKSFYMEWNNFTTYFPVSLAVLIMMICTGCLCVLVWKRVSPIVNASGFKLLASLCCSSACTALLVIIPLVERMFPAPSTCIPVLILLGIFLALNQTLVLMKARMLIYEISGNVQRFHFGIFWADSQKITICCSALTQTAFIIIWIFIKKSGMKYFENPSGIPGYTAICSSLFDRDAILLYVQPCFQILMTVITLFKFQKNISTHLKLLEHRYLLISTILSGVLMGIIIFPDIILSNVEKHEGFHIKLGCLAGGVALQACTTLIPAARIVWIVLFHPDWNDINYVKRELSTIRRGIEKYKIDKNSLQLDKAKRIGEGHFAWVIKATQDIGDGSGKTREVAIKKLKESADNPSERRKFYEEAFYMSQLIHKNIAHFYGTCETGAAHLLVMEFIDGGSLEDYLRKERKGHNRLFIRHLIGFCKDISEACLYLEEKKIIHRDIKAENCLMRTLKGNPNANFIIKLSDFGLARDIHSNSSYKVTAFTLAPIRHTAPEGFDAEFTTKSDVWSFGVLVWQIFNFAARPLSKFEDREMYAVVVERKQTVLDHDPEDAGIQVPQKLKNLMQICLKYEAEERPGFQEINTCLCHMENQGFKKLVFQVSHLDHQNSEDRPTAQKNTEERNYDIFERAYSLQDVVPSSIRPQDLEIIGKRSSYDILKTAYSHGIHDGDKPPSYNMV